MRVRKAISNAGDNTRAPRVPTWLIQSAAAAAAVVAAVVTVLGQQQVSQSETPTFRAGVDAVQIDAFVTDAEGRPVSGLTVDDFEVYRNESRSERNPEQTVTRRIPVRVSTSGTSPLQGTS